MDNYEKQQAFVDAVEDVETTRVGRYTANRFAQITNIAYKKGVLFQKYYSPDLSRMEMVRALQEGDGKHLKKHMTKSIIYDFCEELDLPYLHDVNKNKNKKTINEAFFKKHYSKDKTTSCMADLALKEKLVNTKSAARSMVVGLSKRLKMPLHTGCQKFRYHTPKGVFNTQKEAQIAEGLASKGKMRALYKSNPTAYWVEEL